MPGRTKKSQLELFNKQAAISVEERLNQLEEEIRKALKSGDLKRAEALIEEQRTLLESQMSSGPKS
ncbi:hypothetical protein BMS3Abin05_02467 [bacterium BMS3Abin05]|nr:hypothetical protein BMS3Abin05_02467 [bacterium BMS3Abin05]GBE28324.1 hypothetical protein BMS3Bbin03_02263 [bacterium BMS3Bbin03]HDZ10663.1 hypothetical protein [Bacteroidota bacterium]